MVIKNIGQEFTYEGIVYRIGDEVIGTSQSAYEGLLGTITEIRDGKDKDTENETPELYCRFDPPVLPGDIMELEERFSELCGHHKQLEDIILDSVIVTPEMIRPIDYMESSKHAIPVYSIREDWMSDGEGGYDVTFFTDCNEAKLEFNKLLSEDMRNGLIADWSDRDDFRVETGSNYYECWLKGAYYENHYKITIYYSMVKISETVMSEIGRAYIDEGYHEDFLSQLEEMPEADGLTDEQWEELQKDPNISERIQKALGRNDYYWESYWNSISQVAQDMIKEIQRVTER